MAPESDKEGRVDGDYFFMRRGRSKVGETFFTRHQKTSRTRENPDRPVGQENEEGEVQKVR